MTGCSANKHCIFGAKSKVFAVQVGNFARTDYHRK
nr:MAG TPA: hypothetical protein [Caudoviricetes sp.]